MGVDRSDSQGTDRALIEPAGRAEATITLETGKCGTGSAAEVTIDRAAIVAELPQALLRAGLGAHRASAAVAVIAVIMTMIVVLLVTRWFRTAGTAEEKVQGRCPGDTCRADKKDAQCDGRYVFHNNDETSVGWDLFNHSSEKNQLAIR